MHCTWCTARCSLRVHQHHHSELLRATVKFKTGAILTIRDWSYIAFYISPSPSLPLYVLVWLCLVRRWFMVVGLLRQQRSVDCYTFSNLRKWSCFPVLYFNHLKGKCFVFLFVLFCFVLLSLPESRLVLLIAVKPALPHHPLMNINIRHQLDLKINPWGKYVKAGT